MVLNMFSIFLIFLLSLVKFNLSYYIKIDSFVLTELVFYTSCSLLSSVIHTMS